MYRIAICEDEAVFRAEHERICRRIFAKLNIEYHISSFESSAAFLDAFSKGRRYDLFLLDIVMDETNGMELARKIRESGDDAAIIFITSNPDHVWQGYDVGALHYLMKPPDGDVLERLIASDYDRRFQSGSIVVRAGAQTLRIPAEDVICLETVGKRVAVTLDDRTVECSGKLSELLSGLPKEQFVRCHVAYAVNVRKMQEITRTDAVAVNGKKIPISRAYSKDVQKAFLRKMRKA
ncbi:MAG: LytTR family DNA-binding domain-containing protein [Oscillospiraceae bacterium]|nr:LytTR family DNA-binding domain-containing protein [Oscillospiraceae bacterium]